MHTFHFFSSYQSHGTGAKHSLCLPPDFKARSSLEVRGGVKLLFTFTCIQLPGDAGMLRVVHPVPTCPPSSQTQTVWQHGYAAARGSSCVRVA